MATKQTARKKNNWLVRILLVVVAVFCFLKFVQIQAQIREKQTQIAQLHGEIATAQLYNEDLNERSENYEERLEQQLRENGYVYTYDQVYQFAN